MQAITPTPGLRWYDHRGGTIALLLGGLLATPMLAQTAAPNQPAQGNERSYHAIIWWEPLAVSAGIAATFLVDQPIHDYSQAHKDSTKDDIAKVAGYFHEPQVTLVAAAGALGLGAVTRDMKAAQTGFQILVSYGLASGMMIATKWVFGRSRPSDTPDDNTNFDWFNGSSESSFPSGASAVTFSLATTVADAVDHPAATVVLYAGATLNAWSRVYKDRHWFSDVALGAVYGVTAAKLVNGHWRIFGFRPPTVAIDAHGRMLIASGFSW
jgi:membrane-associated phospholipid phosphatase